MARAALALLTTLPPVAALASTTLRVATWNLQEVGAVGSPQYDAALDVLGRIDAAVIAVNEIWDDTDAGRLIDLAAAAGYPHRFVAPGGPLGDMRSAVLSKHPFVDVRARSSADLSGDSQANDLTRYFIEARIDPPGSARDLVLVCNHWKASWGDDDEFRRAVESLRGAQIASAFDSAEDAYVIAGDLNEEIEDVPQYPTFFTSLPDGLPWSYRLGEDLYELMTTEGIYNDPFEPLNEHAQAVDAWQLDGQDATHPSTGQRLDYLLMSAALVSGGVATEVYDSADEWRGGGLPKAGDPLGAGTSATASDHLPVLADIVVPGTGPVILPPRIERHRWSPLRMPSADPELSERIAANHQALRPGHRDEWRATPLTPETPAQERYDVLHYTIDIDVDPGIFSRDIDGSCEITLTPTLDALDEVELDLDWRMKVGGVSDSDGSPLPYRHRLDRLRIELDPALAVGEEETIRIEYGGSPLTNFYGFDIWRLRPTPVVYTLCEPNGSRTWWPCKDLPGDKATVDLIITMPQKYVVAGNGLLEGVRTNDDGTSTHHWSTRYPLAPYLVAFTATNFVLIEDSYEMLGGGTLPLLYYTWPEDVRRAERDVASIPGMLAVFEEEWFGYPFPEEKYGHMETPLVVGAMEHTTMTSYGQALYTGTGYFDYVAAHELAHHWWGDLVTCGTWDDIWLNEGFATYAEAVYHESLAGFEGYLDYMRALSRPRFYGSIYAPNRVLNDTVYDKGAWVLHMLRGIVGRETLMEILRTWGERFAHTSPVTADFTALASEVAGQDLSWFFDPWLYEIGRPDYEYAQRIHPAGEERSWIRLRIEQLQEGVEAYSMPITVRARADDGTHQDVVVFNSRRAEEFGLMLGGRIVDLELDPDDFILADFQRRDWGDNTGAVIGR